MGALWTDPVAGGFSLTRALPTRSIIVVLTLLATALAGCLTPETTDSALISRQHVMVLDPKIAEQLEEYGDDPEGALDLLLDTTLVVRAPDEGDYVLEYTDESGASRTKELTGMTPGTPQMVSGADPLAPAVLKRGGEIAAVRAGMNGAWWRVGDVPLGFNVTPGAKSLYDVNARLEEALTLSDLNVEQMDLQVASLAFRLNLPLAGVASWEMSPDDGIGAPVLLNGEVSIPSNAGDLATIDVTATMEGRQGTAGLVSSFSEAVARGSAKVWIKDEQPVAAQFLGGSAKATPRVTMWADGFFADLAEGQSCAGKSRADACSPTELEAFDETVDADERIDFPVEDYPKADDDESAREAIALLQRLFAVDIVPGDSATLTFRADSRDIMGGDPSAPDGDFLFEFSIEATDVEDVTVPAGTFRALKILEETRTVLNLRQLDDGAGTTLVEGFSMDETVARMTMWLDASTYEPVKMVAETPIDLDSLLKRMMDAIEPGVWDQIGGKPIENSQWKVTATGESSYALREHRDGTHFSALAGLSLAHMLAGTFSGGPAGALMTGFGTSRAVGSAIPVPEAYPYDEDYPTEAPRFEPISLSLTSAGALENGMKDYTVAAASGNLSWARLMVNVDGMDRYLEGSGDCLPADEYVFVACRGDVGMTWEDDVMAGDTLRVAAESGQTLRVIDTYSNSVVLSLTVS